jgi:ADP-ribose pyrophosphatase YjhB (NUDIX family)
VCEQAFPPDADRITGDIISHMPPTRIRVIAIALVRRNDDLLVFESFDTVKQDYYYRPLGGGVEPGERAADALAREMREELNTEIENVKQVAILENLFECDGKAGHEIVFVFSCDLLDRSIYERESIDAFEQSGDPMRVVWKSVSSFDLTHRLVPEVLAERIKGSFSAAQTRDDAGL